MNCYYLDIYALNNVDATMDSATRATCNIFFFPPCVCVRVCARLCTVEVPLLLHQSLMLIVLL